MSLFIVDIQTKLLCSPKRSLILSGFELSSNHSRIFNLKLLRGHHLKWDCLQLWFYNDDGNGAEETLLNSYARLVIAIVIVIIIILMAPLQKVIVIHGLLLTNTRDNRARIFHRVDANGWDCPQKKERKEPQISVDKTNLTVDKKEHCTGRTTINNNFHF